MEIFWFCIVAFMITTYVILDGFDIGVGILHLRFARDENEKRLLIDSIAPVWDGNEVWLIAGGGLLYLAFPSVYASGFSGFYLPLMILLWLFMFRGAGIELRHHVTHPLWKNFWNVIFGCSSILLAIFYGAALGNIVRGVPLGNDGYFFEPLWTTFSVVPQAGILDWFTVLLGIVALSTLTLHGAIYIAVKTSGEIQERARRTGMLWWWLVLCSSVVAFIATWSIHPDLWKNYSEQPWGFVFPAAGIAGLAGMMTALRRGKDGAAFLSSSLFIGSMLAATAFSLFPNLLLSSTDRSYSLTIYNSAASPYALTTGALWWAPGIILAVVYFIYLLKSFRGKISISADETY